MNDDNKNIAFGNLGNSTSDTNTTNTIVPSQTTSIPFVPSQDTNTPTVVPSQNMEVETAFEFENIPEEVEEVKEEVSEEETPKEARMSFFEPTESTSNVSLTNNNQDKDFFKEVVEEEEQPKKEKKVKPKKEKKKVKFNIGPLLVVIIFIAAIYGVFYYLINYVKPNDYDEKIDYAEQYDPTTSTTTTENKPNGLPQ